MSRAGNRIRKGLEEAIRFADGRASKDAYRVHVPEHIDVKAIRAKLGMTQKMFAALFGFSINTLRHWEQGKRQPEGPTRAYLLVIYRAPEAVQKALRIDPCFWEIGKSLPTRASARRSADFVHQR